MPRGVLIRNAWIVTLSAPIVSGISYDERINRVRDQYVRRDDHDRAYDALRELLMDIRQGQVELNRRIDQALTRGGGSGS